MGGIFYIIGISFAAYAGFNHFQWYYILISSSIMIIGYFIIRAPQINGRISRDGISVVIKILPLQIIIYSIITGPVYLMSSILN
jgi:hypothetical protein